MTGRWDAEEERKEKKAGCEFSKLPCGCLRRARGWSDGRLLPRSRRECGGRIRRRTPSSRPVCPSACVCGGLVAKGPWQVGAGFRLSFTPFCGHPLRIAWPSEEEHGSCQEFFGQLVRVKGRGFSTGMLFAGFSGGLRQFFPSGFGFSPLQGIDEKFLVLVRKGLDDFHDFTEIRWRIHGLQYQGKGDASQQLWRTMRGSLIKRLFRAGVGLG